MKTEKKKSTCEKERKCDFLDFKGVFKVRSHFAFRFIYQNAKNLILGLGPDYTDPDYTISNFFFDIMSVKIPQLFWSILMDDIGPITIKNYFLYYRK